MSLAKRPNSGQARQPHPQAAGRCLPRFPHPRANPAPMFASRYANYAECQYILNRQGIYTHPWAPSAHAWWVSVIRRFCGLLSQLAACTAAQGKRKEGNWGRGVWRWRQDEGSGAAVVADKTSRGQTRRMDGPDIRPDV